MKSTKKSIIKLVDWSLSFICYAVILILVATFFDSFTIDDRHLYLYGICATFIIFILNKTIKPLLFWLTIPLTGITLGLLYPLINVFILKLCDWILGPYFQIHGTLAVFFIAILISVLNVLIDNIIIKPIIRRLKKNG